MRKQFVKTLEKVLDKDKKLVLILGDIGVFGFRNAFAKHPTRVYNIGILEQATISLAAGLAKTNLIPVVHTITPFIVERGLEQIKVDFAFQKLGGNFVSVGASYDYAALGATHHCPSDIAILKNIPGMEIIVPGTAEEFDTLFKQSYADGNPTYFRLSERGNENSKKVKFGKANVVKKGKKATVIAVGPMLKTVLEATEKEDVTILYYTTLFPFDSKTLKNNLAGNKILICEPYYEGALDTDVINTFPGKAIEIVHAGMPKRFLTKYGKAEEHDKDLGMTPNAINKKLKKLING
ncbi:MAG: transketolase C-terminal domain-containing protein [Minisyncoccia bacterium]